MKKTFILMLSACLMMACGKPSSETPGTNPTTETKTDGLKQLELLWKTSPLIQSTERTNCQEKLQAYADACSSTAFKNLLSSDQNKYTLTVKYDNILSCYDAAFERVLSALKEGKPSKGEVNIWLLYNMGYIIQTPSKTFGLDIYHYRAAELAPYLDFIGSTHVHQDHKSEPLMAAMYKAGKPVLSNYFEPEKNYVYTASVTKDYEFGACKIHTFITKHNNSTTNVPVTVFQIDCGEDAGGLVLMHSGDSNFIASEYDVTEKINVYIPRYAPNALAENQVIGQVFQPDYVLLSHILELSHKDIYDSRWSFELALERASKIDCEKTYVPFWGEKLVWKNGKLN